MPPMNFPRTDDDDEGSGLPPVILIVVSARGILTRRRAPEPLVVVVGVILPPRAARSVPMPLCSASVPPLLSPQSSRACRDPNNRNEIRAAEGGTLREDCSPDSTLREVSFFRSSPHLSWTPNTRTPHLAGPRRPPFLLPLCLPLPPSSVSLLCSPRLLSTTATDINLFKMYYTHAIIYSLLKFNKYWVYFTLHLERAPCGGKGGRKRRRERDRGGGEKRRTTSRDSPRMEWIVTKANRKTK